MGQVTLEINGRSFEIACDDGQEDHVCELGADIDRRVRDLVHSVGQVGETRLLVMAALLLADELHEATNGAQQVDNGALPPAAGLSDEDEEAVAASLENVAERLERIAAQLETS